jgi:hypothetical protein
MRWTPEAAEGGTRWVCAMAGGAQAGDDLAGALVVGGVEPQERLGRGGGFVEAGQPPEADAEAMHAAQERPVVEPPPGQDAVEPVGEAELGDRDAKCPGAWSGSGWSQPRWA